MVLIDEHSNLDFSILLLYLNILQCIICRLAKEIKFKIKIYIKKVMSCVKRSSKETTRVEIQLYRKILNQPPPRNKRYPQSHDRYENPQKPNLPNRFPSPTHNPHTYKPTQIQLLSQQNLKRSTTLPTPKPSPP